VLAYSSRHANFHNSFGALDIHTFSLLLELFDAAYLIRHGFPWSRNYVAVVLLVGGSKASHIKFVLQREHRTI
jgi:hypothetical protein